MQSERSPPLIFCNVMHVADAASLCRTQPRYELRHVELRDAASVLISCTDVSQHVALGCLSSPREVEMWLVERRM